MRTQWKNLKSIIALSGFTSKQYLSVLDEKGNILLANARMKKELKLKNPRQVKTNFFDLLHPVHFEDLQKAFQYSMKNCNPYSMEFYLRNGCYHSMKFQVSYLQSHENGRKIFLFQGNSIDETSEKEKGISSDHKFSENIFKAFVENTPNLTWVLNEGNKLMHANPMFLQYFKLDKSAFCKKITDLLPSSLADELVKKHQQVLKTGMPVELIENKNFQNGDPIKLRIKIFSTESESGEKITAGIGNNLLERYEVLKKLEDAIERLNSLHRITSDAIWEVNLLTGEVSRNDKVQELTGYTPEESTGREWWFSLIHPDDLERQKAIMKDVDEKKRKSWENEYRILCKDGEYKTIHDRGFVIYENGTPVRMIGSYNDITSEKLMENLMVEEKLHQQKEQAEVAIQVQERERTNIGRELHDNVNQILGASKLFMGMVTPANEEEKDFKAKSMEYIVSAIEEIRKLSRELVSPQLKEKTLVNTIQSMIDDVNRASEIQIKFTHDQESDLLSPGKKLTLYRIVQEQVKNILKYSKTKKAEILLQSKGNDVQLVIRDYGIGFDPKRTNSGVGLTSIIDRAKFYSGKAEINSAPGKGCTLTITIPIVR